MKRAPHVVGLDLSLTGTGIADRDGGTRVLNTPASKVSGMARLHFILNEVVGACYPDPDPDYTYNLPVDLVVIEGYSFGSRGSQAHSLGELGGVVRHELFVSGVAYLDVPPSVLKVFATGHGNAKKPEMVAQARERLGYPGFNEDGADALWLRAFGLHYLGYPLVDLPKSHLRGKVAEMIDSRPATA